MTTPLKMTEKEMQQAVNKITDAIIHPVIRGHIDIDAAKLFESPEKLKNFDATEILSSKMKHLLRSISAILETVSDDDSANFAEKMKATFENIKSGLGARLETDKLGVFKGIFDGVTTLVESSEAKGWRDSVDTIFEESELGDLKSAVTKALESLQKVTDSTDVEAPDSLKNKLSKALTELEKSVAADIDGKYVSSNDYQTLSEKLNELGKAYIQEMQVAKTEEENEVEAAQEGIQNIITEINNSDKQSTATMVNTISTLTFTNAYDENSSNRLNNAQSDFISASKNAKQTFQDEVVQKILSGTTDLSESSEVLTQATSFIALMNSKKGTLVDVTIDEFSNKLGGKKSAIEGFYSDFEAFLQLLSGDKLQEYTDHLVKEYNDSVKDDINDALPLIDISNLMNSSDKFAAFVTKKFAEAFQKQDGKDQNFTITATYFNEMHEKVTENLFTGETLKNLLNNSELVKEYIDGRFYDDQASKDKLVEAIETFIDALKGESEGLGTRNITEEREKQIAALEKFNADFTIFQGEFKDVISSQKTVSDSAFNAMNNLLKAMKNGSNDEIKLKEMLGKVYQPEANDKDFVKLSKDVITAVGNSTADLAAMSDKMKEKEYFTEFSHLLKAIAVAKGDSNTLTEDQIKHLAESDNFVAIMTSGYRSLLTSLPNSDYIESSMSLVKSLIKVIEDIQDGKQLVAEATEGGEQEGDENSKEQSASNEASEVKKIETDGTETLQEDAAKTAAAQRALLVKIAEALKVNANNDVTTNNIKIEVLTVLTSLVAKDAASLEEVDTKLKLMRLNDALEGENVFSIVKDKDNDGVVVKIVADDDTNAVTFDEALILEALGYYPADSIAEEKSAENVILTTSSDAANNGEMELYNQPQSPSEDTHQS